MIIMDNQEQQNIKKKNVQCCLLIDKILFPIQCIIIDKFKF